MARIAFRLPSEFPKAGTSLGLLAGTIGLLALGSLMLNTARTGRQFAPEPSVRSIQVQSQEAPYPLAVADYAAAAPRALPLAREGEAPPAVRLPGAMLIRTGTLALRVDSLGSAVARAESLALRLGGLVATSTAQGEADGLRSASLTIRVPSAAFDRLLHGLGRLGPVEQLQVSTEDVGEEYVDVQARLANAHRLEARLIGLLATRAGRLTDVLAVERELARVREGAEQMEGRRRYLDAHTAMSSLDVRFATAAPVGVTSPGMFREAAEDAWLSFQWLVAFAIRSSGVVLPFAAIALLVWGLRRRFAAA